ncbi:MAG: hypothetical protein SFV15_18410 [Polyangiaceae bacterium]|nr:hypothetical protein [Polyangiaceae bacterium]
MEEHGSGAVQPGSKPPPAACQVVPLNEGGELRFQSPVDVSIPAEIPVKSGECGNTSATLTLRAATAEVVCRYAAQGPKGTVRAANSKLSFVGCSPAASPGAAVQADYIRLATVVARAEPGDDEDDAQEEQDDDDQADDAGSQVRLALGLSICPRVDAPTNIEWAESPVELRATRFYHPERSEDASVNLAEPVEFEIPSKLRVIEGGSGDGETTLTFKDATTQKQVVCTYSGGADDECRSDAALRAARSRFYYFDGCQRGYQAGQRVRSSSYQLKVRSGDEAASIARTTVEVFMGVHGCSEPLDQPISAEQSIRMRRAFSWNKTRSVPETLPDGKPTLWYASIYVRDREELAGLDDLLIHHQNRPLFLTEMEGYRGRCGAIEYDGDGAGTFVFAVLPGITYNLIRQAALADPQNPLFEALVLRDIPPTARARGGSLSWDALKLAGFYYRDLRTFTLSNELQQPFWNALKRRVAKTIAKAVQVVVKVVVDGLGEIDKFASGKIVQGIEVHIANRDPAFESPTMTQAWGAKAGQELRLDGVRVEVRQWAQRLWSLGIPLPTSFNNTLQDGVTYMEVAKDASPRDGGICMEVKNAGAELTTFLLPTEVCDFGQEFKLSTQRDSTVTFTTGSYPLHTLNMLTDAYRYSQSVVGYSPHQVTVAHGWLGTLLGGAKGRIYAPCFGFPNISQDTMGALLSSIVPVAGEIVGVLSAVDIVMPNVIRARKSRGIMVHEYGHYFLCSSLFDAKPTAMSGFTAARVFEDTEFGPDDDNAVLNEAFADFFVHQVVSGTNYFALPDTGLFTYGMTYCTGGSCPDANATGIQGSGGIFEFYAPNPDLPDRLAIDRADLAVARATTLFHDAFDGWAWRGQNVPTTGDAWVSRGGKLGFNGWGFPEVFYGDTSDEVISLPGNSIASWLQGWAHKQTVTTLNRDDFFSSLREVIRGHSWCEICDLFALHQPDVGPSARERMTACAASPLATWVGVPPAPLSRLADSCTVCQPTEVLSGGVCVPCGARETADPSGLACTCADPDDVRISGTCTPCLAGQVPNADRTACLGCPVDATLNIAPPGGWDRCLFADSEVVVGGGSAECDGVHVAEFVGIQDSVPLAPACGVTDFPFRTDVAAATQAECEAARGQVVIDLVLVNGQTLRIMDQPQVGTFHDDGSLCAPQSTFCASLGSTCELVDFTLTPKLLTDVERIRVTVKSKASIKFASEVGYVIIR